MKLQDYYWSLPRGISKGYMLIVIAILWVYTMFIAHLNVIQSIKEMCLKVTDLIWNYWRSKYVHFEFEGFHLLPLCSYSTGSGCILSSCLLSPKSVPATCLHPFLSHLESYGQKVAGNIFFFVNSLAIPRIKVQWNRSHSNTDRLVHGACC